MNQDDKLLSQTNLMKNYLLFEEEQNTGQHKQFVSNYFNQNLEKQFIKLTYMYIIFVCGQHDNQLNISNGKHHHFDTIPGIPALSCVPMLNICCSDGGVLTPPTLLADCDGGTSDLNEPYDETFSAIRMVKKMIPISDQNKY